MNFTMRFTAHPERKTAFQVRLEELDRIHATIKKGCPWKNGFIERSNRTDNDECFDVLQFTSSEERRYQHRLWEMHYGARRPHQGLKGLTPLQVYQRDYRLHAATRMLI